MEKWIDINKQKPEYGEVVEVIRIITGAGTPAHPDFAYIGKARYREPSSARANKITPLSYWVFDYLKIDPSYHHGYILKNNLAPTHWRRINGI